MNILSKYRLMRKNGMVSIERKNKEVFIENKSNEEQTIIVANIFKTKNMSMKIDFKGELISGNGGIVAKMVARDKTILCEIPLNSCVYGPRKSRFYMLALRIMPMCKVKLSDLSIDYIETYDKELKMGLNSDAVLIVPGYPSSIKKYNFSFVHSKVKMYKKMGWNIDVLSVNEEDDSIKYTFEDVAVVKTNYLMARDILQEKRYKRIIVHFFKEEYANMLDAVDTSKSEIYLYAHGADVIYRDFNIMNARYFRLPDPISEFQKVQYKRRDKILERYNNKPNVRWIFGTNWEKNRAEETNNIKFNNYSIIPCNVDNNTFKFVQKNKEDRTKIFTIKKFDNFNTYSVDVMVRTILELSRRECFDKLEFNIYGDGTEFDRLLAPVAHFENVHLNKGYLTHEEIAEVHKQNGIGFFPTRYETQGVSASEAAMSGLVVVTGRAAAVPEVFKDSEYLCDPENYVEYADKIEYLYNNPDEYVKLSKQMHDLIYERYSNDVAEKMEAQMMNECKGMKEVIEIPEAEDNRLLTIAIAAYNVEKYLRNSVLSLLRSKYASKLEIIIVNDGSKDNTSKVGKELEEMTTINGKSIVKLVDKENGGHGSALNKGIELATGKYFKVMDGDDYFNTEALDKLMEILEKCNSDMVLNRYVEDLAIPSIMNVKEIYDFLVPGFEYNLEDLCIDGYGFGEWGPLLSTSTYKTKMLQDANFKISEKCFYVDMELNTYAFINAKTIVYYPLDLYIYFIGRAGQSISQASYMKNYKHHEHVILKLIDEYTNNKNITPLKKEYIRTKIINPMVKCQYLITTEFFSNSKPFKSFDPQLKPYGEFYNIMEGRRIKINRATSGKTIKLFHIIDAVKRRIKR